MTDLQQQNTPSPRESNQIDSNSGGFRYMAFISYRHADNREEGRQWASWLHQAIETYEVPNDLVGEKNSRGEEIPARIFPIFRDEDDLPADADLENSITRALDNSQLLIVLCSPRAVESTYVADEIDYFKRLGRSNRIIAAIIDGEPNASLDVGKQRSGLTGDDECFPSPLQYEYDHNGPTSKRAEPIAADFRVNANGIQQQGWCNLEAYRRALKVQGLAVKEINQRLDDYRKQQHLMLLKIIAGILGVPLGKLTKRDQEYQLAQEREKAKKLRRWLSAVAALAVVAILAGVAAWQQRGVAIEQQQIAIEQKNVAQQRFVEAMQSNAMTKTLEAEELSAQENYRSAAKLILSALPSNIETPEWPIDERTKVALQFAMSNLRDTIIFSGPEDVLSKLDVVAENHLLAITDTDDVYLYKQDGTLINSIVREQSFEFALSTDKRQLLATSWYQTIDDGGDYRRYLPTVAGFRVDLVTGSIIEYVPKQWDVSFLYEFSNGGYSRQIDANKGYWLLRDYENPNTILVTNVIDWSVVRRISVPDDYRINGGYFLTNDAILLEAENNQSKQLVLVDEQPQVIYEYSGYIGCDDSRLVGGASGNSQRYSVSDDGQYLILSVTDVNNNWEWCLTGWSLSSMQPLPISKFSDYGTPELNESNRILLELAENAQPPLVIKRENGGYSANKNTTFVRGMDSQGETLSASADDATISITDGKTEQKLLHGGGNIDATTLNTTQRRVWVASRDRNIYGYALTSNAQTAEHGVQYLNSLLPTDKTLVLLDGNGVDYQYRVLSLDDMKLTDAWQSLPVEESERVASVFIDSQRVGILFSEQAADWQVKPDQRVDFFHITTGEKLGSCPITTSIDGKPSIGANYVVSINKKNNNELQLCSLLDYQLQTVPMPENWVADQVAFSEGQFYVTGFDGHFDEPDARSSAVLRIDLSKNAIEIIYAQKAQSIEFHDQPSMKGLLLSWRLGYSDNGIPSAVSYLSVEGEHVELNSEKWADQISYQNIWLEPESQTVYIFDRGNEVTMYNYAAEMVARQPVANGSFGFTGVIANGYAVSGGKLTKLAQYNGCEFQEDATLNAFSPSHRYVALSQNDLTAVYSVETCSPLYSLNANDHIVLYDNGSAVAEGVGSLHYYMPPKPFAEVYQRAISLAE